MVHRHVATWAILLAGLILATRAPAALERGPARCVPATELRAYVEYDGLDAHANAWKKTAAYAVLHRTQAGALVLDLTRQVLNWRLKPAAGDQSAGEVALLFGEHVLRRGFKARLTIGLGNDDRPEFQLKNQPLDDNAPVPVK